MKTLAELDFDPFHLLMHCLKSAQIRSYFWSVFSCIRTEYGEILRILPTQSEYRKKRTRNKSVFGHFSRNPNTKKLLYHVKKYPNAEFSLARIFSYAHILNVETAK